jgi:hypothetical protein
MVPYSSIVAIEGFPMVPRSQQGAPWFGRSQHGKQRKPYKTNKQHYLINRYLFNKKINIM